MSSFSRKRSKKRLFCFAEDLWVTQTSAKRNQGGLGKMIPILKPIGLMATSYSRISQLKASQSGYF
jgi:hypothetical protein